MMYLVYGVCMCACALFVVMFEASNKTATALNLGIDTRDVLSVTVCPHARTPHTRSLAHLAHSPSLVSLWLQSWLHPHSPVLVQ